MDAEVVEKKIIDSAGNEVNSFLHSAIGAEKCGIRRPAESRGALMKIVNFGARQLTAAAMAASTLAGASIATASSARAEPAGQYYYECVTSAGWSYFLRPGTALTSCKGSGLHVYINGRMVKNIRLNGYGQPAKPVHLSGDCIVAMIGTGIVVADPTFTVKFVASYAIATYGLKACKA